MIYWKPKFKCFERESSNAYSIVEQADISVHLKPPLLALKSSLSPELPVLATYARPQFFLWILDRNEQFLETVLQSLKTEPSPHSDFAMQIGVNIVNLAHAAIAEDPAYSQCIVARRLTIHDDLKNLHPRNNIYVNLVQAELQERVKFVFSKSSIGCNFLK